MLKQVAGEVYRVLKPGGVLGILLGDTRVGGHCVPITHYALAVLLGVGFVLKEGVKVRAG
jgi:ubiquinone/menaquinone biosynthesis C-methylase UbiE